MTGWETILPLLVQVPLVGIFIVFVLVRDGRADVAQSKRDAEWQSFLKEQREANNDALKDMARETSEMAKLVTVTNSLLVQHDTAERDIWTRVLGKIE